MVKKNNKVLNIKDFVLLFLFGYMLFRSSTVGISLYVILFSICVYLFACRKAKIDRLSFYLASFSFFYAIISYIQTGVFNPHQLVYLVAPLAFYFWGQYVINHCNDRKAVFFFLCFFLLLFALNTYYLTITDIIEVGLINSYRGMLRSGDSDVVMPATLFGLNVSLGLSGLAIFLSQAKSERSIISYLYLFILALSLLTTVHLINRTGIYIFIICSIIVFLYTITSRKGFLVYSVGLCLFAAFLYWAFSNYMSLGSDTLEAYSLRERIEGTSLSDFGDRGWRWVDAIQRVFTDPFGWSGSVPYNYAHNLWLDVAMLRGIIPFSFLILATVRSFRQLVRLCRIRRDSIVATFIALNVCFFLASFVEPVMIGFDVFFYLYCMLWGMQQCYLRVYSQFY